MKNKKEELDSKGLNEVIKLSKKILKIFYIVLIIGTVLAVVTTLFLQPKSITDFISKLI